ncbi:MAG: DUF4271 domain-containing protein [Prevotella sp.]|jgi:hypothetical protein|nr:DUF4271 domain-containing protein [Prevotella sp.]MCI2086891.1 DUF4271 domain-containing protein [Prevotella sp.]MCI2124025.1 DUF4271 domain-containing protein [Prevotella sp.]
MALGDFMPLFLTLMHGPYVLERSIQHQPTPAQVLKRLPEGATPGQQDSAIQRNIHPGKVHWSTMPDTLHLPGQVAGKSVKNVVLPTYYKESFFSRDSMFHPELPGGRLGVAGDPVPYTIAGDDLLTVLLLACFILAMVAFAKCRSFFYHQAKNFFFPPRMEQTAMTETSNEFRYQFFFILQTCLLFALTFFLYTRSVFGDTFAISRYKIIGIYTVVLAGYFFVKGLAYWFINWIFFDKRKNEQWFHAYFFLISTEGVVLFPMIMLMAYFRLPLQTGMIYALIVVVLFKLLTFYKAFIIFSQRISAIVQNILYFCTLEVIPMLVLWGIWEMIGNDMKITF